MTNPPDTRPYCKSMAKLVRLKVCMSVDFKMIDRGWWASFLVGVGPTARALPHNPTTHNPQ